MMFWLATGIAIFHIVINLLDPLLCLDVLFSVAGSFALTTVAFELMFYVIILASAAELFCFFRGAIAGGNANEKTQMKKRRTHWKIPCRTHQFPKWWSAAV